MSCMDNVYSTNNRHTFGLEYIVMGIRVLCVLGVRLSLSVLELRIQYSKQVCESAYVDVVVAGYELRYQYAVGYENHFITLRNEMSNAPWIWIAIYSNYNYKQ